MLMFIRNLNYNLKKRKEKKRRENIRNSKKSKFSLKK